MKTDCKLLFLAGEDQCCSNMFLPQEGRWW